MAQLLVISAPKNTITNKDEIEKTLSGSGTVPLFVEYEANSPYVPNISTYLFSKIETAKKEK